MEYIDNSNNIKLDTFDFIRMTMLNSWLLENAPLDDYDVLSLYMNGLTVKTFDMPEYKDLPIEWVIELFKK